MHLDLLPESLNQNSTVRNNHRVSGVQFHHEQKTVTKLGPATLQQANLDMGLLPRKVSLRPLDYMHSNQKTPFHVLGQVKLVNRALRRGFAPERRMPLIASFRIGCYLEHLHIYSTVQRELVPMRQQTRCKGNEYALINTLRGQGDIELAN